MRKKEYWERFEKSGSISDYLNYIACTAEDCARHIANDNKEGGFGGSRIDCDGTGIISDAHWGL
jgi:hypothetical protein